MLAFVATVALLSASTSAASDPASSARDVSRTADAGGVQLSLSGEPPANALDAQPPDAEAPDADPLTDDRLDDGRPAPGGDQSGTDAMAEEQDAAASERHDDSLDSIEGSAEAELQEPDLVPAPVEAAAQPAQADPPEAQRPRVLILHLEAAGAEPDVIRVANGIIAQSVSRSTSIEVVTDADLRRMVELEAEKQMVGVGCDSDSCLAEIAGALGAEFVIFGTVGRLDDLFVVQLNLFDAAKAKPAAREEVRARRASDLATPLTVAAARLVEPLLAKDDPLRAHLALAEAKSIITPASVTTVAGLSVAAAGTLLGAGSALVGLVAFGLMQDKASDPGLRNLSKTTGQIVTVTTTMGLTVAMLGAIGATAGAAWWLLEGE